MSDTTTIPRPAADALAAEEATLRNRLAEVRADARADYSEQTIPELRETLTRVRANRPPHVSIAQPSATAKKAELVTILANAAADMSPVKERLNALRRAAANEEEVLDKVAATPTIEEIRAERAAKIAEVATGWDAERIADIALGYEAEIAYAESWLSVGSIMRSQGKSPQEALAFVVEYQTREILMDTRGVRGSHPTKELARQEKRAGQAKFINDARWLG